MAITFARECLFPEDLEAATLAMQELISTRLAENLALIDAAEASAGNLSELIDEGNQILQELLLQGDGATNIRTLDDLEQFGLLDDEKASLSEKEAFASQSGIILLDGVTYLPGSTSPDANMDDNIEVLRRLYQATGRSLSMAEQVYEGVKATVAHFKLTLQRVPAKRPGLAFSLDEIKELISDPYVTEEYIVILEDFSILVLRVDFLSTNDSLDVTSKRFGIPVSSIAVAVFHKNEIDNSTASINRFQNLGFSGPKLSAILAGQDLAYSPQSPIQAQLNAEYEEASSIIELEQFIEGRFSTLDVQAKNSFRDKLNARITALQNAHLSTIADSMFKVTTIKESDTLARLREKHSDDTIVRLLEERTDVKGLWWGPPDDRLEKALNQAVQSTPPGSSTLSNKYLNGKTFDKIDLKSMMSGMGDLYDAALTPPLQKSQLSKSTRNLTEFIGREPIRSFSTLAEGAALASAQQLEALSGINSSSTADTVTRASGLDNLANQPPPSVNGAVGSSVSGGTVTNGVASSGLSVTESGQPAPETGTEGADATEEAEAIAMEPLQGQPSGSSTSAVLTDLFDPAKTLDMDDRIENVTNVANASLSALYPPEMAAPLARISNILADLFNKSMATCARAVETARAKILGLKGKLDSFMSKFLTLTGSGSYQKSILKCVTVNVSLSVGALDRLSGVATKIASIGGKFLSAVASWVNNLVDKIICLSTNLLDSFLGNTLPVPAGCIAPRVNLGSSLNSALNKLKFVGVAKTSVFGVFGRDTVRVKVMVESAPAKVKQFKAGAQCSAPQIGDFFNKSMLQVKIPKVPTKVSLNKRIGF